ncbi:MAG: two-component regulator propeller domain-containing protein [Candidatus Latescibacterota bacterium]|jgi:signal transduction histidine kinase/ligand-binding sensor domain-containing protein
MVRRYQHRVRGIVALLLTATVGPVQAGDHDSQPLPVAAQAGGPTLARLLVWAPPSRLAAYEASYEAEVAPLLARHGLVPSADSLGLHLGSCFTRLFQVDSLEELTRIEVELSSDSLLLQAIGRLGDRLGVASLSFGLFDPLTEIGKQIPAGPGRRALAGTGSHTGPWHRLGVADGLPDPAVLCVYQDHQGNLWFGTDGGGVSRYDGEEFVTFTTADGLPSNVISHILEDRAGGIWLGTGTWRAKPRGNGVARYDGRSFTTFTPVRGSDPAPVLSMLEDREGRVWISLQGGGISRYDGERMVRFAATEALALSQDQQGALWLGTPVGVVRLDGPRVTTFTTADGLVNDVVWSILVDRQGSVWLGTAGGVSRFDGRRFTNYTEKDGLAQNQVTSMLQDRLGNLWFGTWQNGVSRFDGQRFTTFTTADGLAHWRVLSMLQDQGGDLWFGGGGEDASGNGVSRYVGDEFTTFTTADGLSRNEVMCLTEDRQGRLWIGTWEGVDWYDGRAVHHLEGLRANVRAILQDRQDHLWFATWDQGVYRYDGKALVQFTRTDGLADIGAETMAEDQQGNLWFGTFRGVSRFDGRRWSSFTTTDDGFRLRSEALLVDRQGVVWSGAAAGNSRGGGTVSRYDGQRWTTFAKADGLADSRVTCIQQDRQGNLWFGSEDAGVTRYDGHTFRVYTTADGLGSNKILNVLEDRDGLLWFAAYGGGVTRYDGTAFQTLLQRDGLAHDAAQQVLQDRHGDFWVATEGGLTRYRPRHEAFPISVSRVTADRDYGPAAEITLSSSQEYLAFEFVGKSLRTRPGQLLYLYRLEGHDADWRQTRERRATYGALPVGEYRFQVRAVDRDLSYSEPASVRVRVRWPYERLAWLAALGLAGLAVAWQTARVVRRDRRLQQSNQALAQANLDLTEANQQIQAATHRKSEFLSSMSHDLRTPMNAIIGYTRLLLRKLQGIVDERQLRNLENIQTSAGHLLTMINEILELSRVESGRLEVRPQQVDLKQLAMECAAAVSPLVNPAVELRQELAETPSLRTDPEILRKVLMNLLGNAVKFTTQGSITLSVQPADEAIEIAIADTGVGIPAADLPLIFEEFRQVARQGSAAKEGTGLGLAIARKSVELLGGTIAAKSEVGQGTRFTVRLRDLTT